MAPPSPTEAAMAPGGGLQDELLEGVRALLLGQRRLEQLVADLAQGSSLVPPSLGPEAAAQAAAAEPAQAEHGSSEDDGRPMPLRAQCVDQDAVEPVGRRQSLSSGLMDVEPTAWLSRVQVRQELLDIGSAEQLARECEKETLDVSIALNEGLSKWTSSRSNQNVEQNYLQSSMAKLSAQSTQKCSYRLCHIPVLSPVSSTRACIDIMSMIVLAYNVSSIPYFLAFQVEVGDSAWLRSIEDASVVYWMFDLIVNFRTGYYEDGLVQMNPAKIARRYLMRSFLLDILTLAMDIGSMVIRALETSSSHSAYAPYFRVLKTWRIVRVTGFLRLRTLGTLMGRLSAQSPHASVLAESALNVLKFVVALMWINHMIACLWVFVGCASTSDTGFTWMDLSTGSLDESLRYKDLGETYQYLTALHWSLTQMTPGSMQVFPVNSSERVFNIWCLLGGLLIFSTLVSAISANVAQLKMEMQGHSEKMVKLDRFLYRSEIEADVRVQVCKQVKLRLMHHRPQVVTDLVELDLLSPSLRNELQLALCNPHLFDHELLHVLSITDAASWSEICRTCVHFSILAKLDTLFTPRARAEGMYFVARGSLWYTIDRSFPGELSERVLPGGWFSEAALWCKWWHMGCAEVKASATCEVLLLRAATLLPILLKRGLLGQLIWAYAVSFHTFLKQSVPPLFNLPNDLVVPFGADEVIAAMPKHATAVLGREALKVLSAPPDTLLASWRSQFSQDNLHKLAAEVERGGSALLVTAKSGVVRCVPVVVLRLRRRDDDRLFVRLQTSWEEGAQRAKCQLPGGKQMAGEDPNGCLQRLLQGKLRALASGLTVSGMERQSQQEQSWHFGVTTRYVRTIVAGEWPSAADDALQDFLMVGKQPAGDVPGSPTLSFRSEVQAFAFPTDTGCFYAWLTDEEFGFLSSPQGQPSLLGWLAELSEAAAAARGGAAAGLEAGDGGAAPVPHGEAIAAGASAAAEPPAEVN